MVTRGYHVHIVSYICFTLYFEIEIAHNLFLNRVVDMRTNLFSDIAVEILSN